MRPWTRAALTATVVSCAIALGACGSNTSVPSSGAAALTPALTPATQQLTGGKKGGTLVVYDHEDFASLDPGQSYFLLDYTVINATQRPLFGFRPNNPTDLVPDLAAGPARISHGGRTVTVRIRRGVHFSPPVNREVTSSDVAYAIERGANPDVANPYFGTYFSVIAGAANANGGPISGISTPDRYTIVFHLSRRAGSFFTGALSMPLTAPVPKEFAAPLDAKKPTQYGSVYEAATGPYMLQADAHGRFLGIGYQPGKSATLVRNPNWRAATDARPAYLDRVRINIGGDPNVIGRQVLDGHGAVQNDSPAGPIVKLAYEKHFKQLTVVPGAGVSYVSVNNAHGPFRNADVRKALWAALDREALIKASGGRLVGQLGTHFVYPGTAGYALAGGDRGPGADYNDYAPGNAAVAARYMRLAGYPSGRYTGDQVVTVVGSTGDPADKIAEIVDHALRQLGFKTDFTLVDQSTMISKYCGVPKREIDVCPDMGWVRDWSDPQTILEPVFAGYGITPTGTSNSGQVSWQDAPGTYKPGHPLTVLDQAIKQAGSTSGAGSRALAWARVDRMLVADAAAVPWMFSDEPMIEGRGVRGISDLWDQGSWDYSYTSLN